MKADVWVCVRTIAFFVGVFGLAGCGGGGGAGAPTAPPTYSLIANVSGLSGSGLALAIGSSTDVDVSENGVMTLAMGLRTGSAYSVTIDTQPINPVQICTLSGPTGTVNGKNAEVSVSCVAGNVSTVNAAQATVTIDPSVPSSASAMVANVVSPLDLQGVKNPILVPVSFIGSESLVLAVDKNNNIVLASLTTSNSVNLTADSTALALVRVLIGALPSAAAATQLNAAIRATAEYPNLMSLISAAWAANTSPAKDSAIFNSMVAVYYQIPSTILAQLDRGRLRASAFDASPVQQPSVTVSPSPFPLFTASASVPVVGSLVVGSVSVTGSTPTGGVTVANNSAIAWSFASADTSGNPLCIPTLPAGASPPTSNPDCSVTVSRTSVFDYITAQTSSASIGGNGNAFNLTLEQNNASETLNVVQTSQDIVGYIVGILTAGAAPAGGVSPGTKCFSSMVRLLFPPSQISAIINDQSTSSYLSYLGGLATSIVLHPVDAVNTYNSCTTANAGIELPKGSNPVATSTFIGALISLINSFTNYAVSTSVGAGVTSIVTNSFAIPLEIEQMSFSWYKHRIVGVCESGAPNYSIIDCATSFSFNPLVFTMVPGGSPFTPVLTALDVNGNATLSLPSDLVYNSPQDSNLITLNPQTGAVAAQPLPSGATSAQAVVTVTQTSTGITASYTVNVTDVPTVSVASSPTSISNSGSVMLTATVGPPPGTVTGSPVPTGTVTFTDQTVGALCTDVTLVGGVASCNATITFGSNVTSDLVTATFNSGDSNYVSNQGTTTVTTASVTLGTVTWAADNTGNPETTPYECCNYLLFSVPFTTQGVSVAPDASNTSWNLTVTFPDPGNPNAYVHFYGTGDATPPAPYRTDGGTNPNSGNLGWGVSVHTGAQYTGVPEPYATFTVSLNVVYN